MKTNIQNSQKLKSYGNFKKVLTPLITHELKSYKRVLNPINSSFILIITLLLSNNVISGSSANIKIEKFIDNSDLIVHFKLIDKSSTKESMLNLFEMIENGKLVEKEMMTTGIYTTYTLDVIEVLSGSLDQKTIEVKMSGGCYDDICATSSLGYDYILNKEGVIFLKHDKTSGNYFSYAAKYSAYKLGSDKILFTGDDKPIRKENNLNKILNKEESYQLTLDELKEEILVQKIKNGEEK